MFIVFSFFQIHFQKNSHVSYMHTHTHSCRSSSTLDLITNDSTITDYDFKRPINQAEDEGEEDCEIPGELDILLLQEEKSIQPHEESVEVINLGTDTDKRSRSTLTLEAVSKADWFRCCMTMWKCLLVRMKIFQGWILTL